MKAIVKTKPEPGVDILDVKKPEVKSNEVLIEVKYCGISGTDLLMYEWHPDLRDMQLPVIMGHEFAGVIDEIGRDVTDFRVGERVAVDPGITCGKCYACRTGMQINCYNRRLVLGRHLNGALAKYVAVPANFYNLHEIPDELSFEEGAFLEPFCIGVHAVERSSLKMGDTVAIFGPGPIGLSTLLAAKVRGAGLIFFMGTSRSEARLKTAKSLGAHATINVEKEDVVTKVKDLTEGLGVDIVFEAASRPTATQQALRIVKRGGEVLLVGHGGHNVEINTERLVSDMINLRGIRSRSNSSWDEGIRLLRLRMVDVKPLIDTIVPLDKGQYAFEALASRNGIKIMLEI